jgi:transcriptional regulator PpsR
VNGFITPQQSLGDLDAGAASALVGAAADIALIVNGQGVIRDMACNSEELLSVLEGPSRWLGQPFASTVTVESRPKVEALLREATPNQASPRRQLNHPAARGSDVPILYCAVRVGELGRLVALGRDLRPLAELQQRLVDAQQSMERDYARLRHAETRYRLLFQLSPEPVLVLDSASQRVMEANPAAVRLFGEARRIVGRPMAEAFEPASAAVVQDLLAGVRSAGRSDSVKARLAAGGRECAVSASMLRQNGASLFLVRLSLSPSEFMDGSGKSHLLRFFDCATDGLVVTDREGRITAVNPAFLELAQLASEEQARGQSLERWLGRTGVDFSVMMSNLRQNRAVRLFATRLQGELGGGADVEISAAAAPDGGELLFGFTIRDVGRRLRTDLRAGRELPRSVEQLTELVGRVPLRELVREATDVIERLCIEAALELTGDNRASAAEMLGLSRQSLYVKLRRYGLVEPSEQTETELREADGDTREES